MPRPSLARVLLTACLVFSLIHQSNAWPFGSFRRKLKEQDSNHGVLQAVSADEVLRAASQNLPNDAELQALQVKMLRQQVEQLPTRIENMVSPSPLHRPCSLSSNTQSLSGPWVISRPQDTAQVQSTRASAARLTQEAHQLHHSFHLACDVCTPARSRCFAPCLQMSARLAEVLVNQIRSWVIDPTQAAVLNRTLSGR